MQSIRLVNKFQKYRCISFLTGAAKNDSLLKTYDGLISVVKLFKNEVLIRFEYENQGVFRYLGILV
jgi:hypothetical protein